jgi:DNA polymerase III sliding clamp (beta) subunit (PCNA family)
MMFELKIVRERKAGYGALSAIRSSSDIYSTFRERFERADREEFLVLLLDAKNKLLSFHVVSVGSLTSSIVHPREVFKAAILGNLARPRPSPTQPEGLTVSQLNTALRFASLLVVQRPSLPILSHCLLSNGSLTVTDLENTLTVHLPGLAIEPICVPVALLQKALRFVTDPVLLVKRELAVILNDTFTLPGLDPADFPGSSAQAAHTAIGEPFTLPDHWADLLPAVSQDQSRLNLSGVCIDLAAGYCVSSDGHRLHALRVPSIAEGARGIVPFPAAKLLARFLPKGTIHGQFYMQRPVLTTEQKELLALTISDETPEAVRRKREALEQELQQPRLVRFRAPGVELWTRLIEGEFPEYGSLLQRPTACTSVILLRAPLMETL